MVDDLEGNYSHKLLQLYALTTAKQNCNITRVTELTSGKATSHSCFFISSSMFFCNGLIQIVTWLDASFSQEGEYTIRSLRKPWSFTRLLFCLLEVHIPQKKRVQKSVHQEIMHTVCLQINSDGARPQPVVWQYSFCWHGGKRTFFVNSSQTKKKLEDAYPWNFVFVSVVLQMVERIELPTFLWRQLSMGAFL